MPARAFALVLLLFAAAPVGAQEPVDLGKADASKLQALARQSVQPLTEALRSLEESLKQLEAARAAFDVASKQLAAHLPPTRDGAPPEDETGRLKAALDHAEAQLRHARDHKRMTQGARDLAVALVQRGQDILTRAKAAQSAADGARALAIELAKRVTAGAITAAAQAAAIAPLTTGSIEQAILDIAAAAKRGRDEQAAATAAVRALDEQLALSPPRVRAAEDSVAEATERHRLAVERTKLKAEMEAKDPGVVAAQVAVEDTQREQLGVAHRTQLASVAEGSPPGLRVRELEAALTALLPPDPAKLQLTLESRVPSARAAERAVRVAEAVLAHHARRAELMTQLGAAIATYQAGLDKAAEAAERYRAQLVRLELVVATIEGHVKSGKLPRPTLPEGARPAALAAAQKALSTERAALGARMTALRDRTAGLTRQQEDVAEAIKTHTAELAKARQAFDAEKAWVRWLAEVEKLDLAGLQKRFNAIAQELVAATKAVDAARGTLRSAAGPVRDATRAAELFEAPLTRRAQQQQGALLDRFVAFFKSVAEPGQDVPVVGISILTDTERQRIIDQLAWQTTGLSPKTVEERSGELQALSTQVDPARYEPQLGLLTAKSRSMEFQSRQRLRLIAALKAKAGHQAALIGAIETQVRLARQLYGAGLELQLRLGRGEIREADLPPGAREAAARDRVQALEDALADAGRDAAALTAEISAQQVLQQRMIQLAKGHTSEAKAVADKLEALRERARLQAEAELPWDKLVDTERKELERRVLQRLIRGSTWVEQFLARFKSTDADQLTALLKAYYQELLLLERQQTNIDRRAAVTRRLGRHLDRSRKAVTALLEHDRAEEQRLAYEVERTRLELAAPLVSETARQVIATRYKELTGAPLPVEDQPDAAALPRYLAEAGNRLFRVATQQIATLAWSRAHARDLSDLGFDAELGNVNEEVAALEAKKLQLRPQIERLSGRSPEAIEALDPDERPKTEEERSRFLEGEIGQTRALRLSLLMTSATWSVASLFFIPLLALVLIRLANRLGQRIVNSMAVVDEHDLGQKERAMRAQTLIGILRTVWTTFVFVLAAIYMLKLLRVDVAPLIASAGIVGLAVAFGAQSLVKDYFSGFCILLEHQYQIGDTITISTITGTVEKITLRLTVLRDVYGTVHFFPNGQIGQVSNWTKQWARVVLDVGVAYDEDPERVFAVLREVGQSMQADPIWGQQILEPIEVLGVQDFGESSVTIRMRIKVHAGAQWELTRAARLRVKKAFDAHNITIPYPQRVIHHIHESKDDLVDPRAVAERSIGG